MSNGQTARDLVAHQSYSVAGSGASELTRKACVDQEWVFGATGGNEFMIKFDKNFFKKHLMTYSKKTEEVADRAKGLWEAAGKPSGRDVEFWLTAETEKLYGKLTKSTSARIEAKVCRLCKKFASLHTCSGCGHGADQHISAAGNRKDCAIGGCVCLKTAPVSFNCPTGGTQFVASTGDYTAARDAKGKPDANPLAGAQTSKNTCLILDRIPMADFKSVVIAAIEHEETGGFTWPTAPSPPVMPPVPSGFGGASVKHVNWDFGNRFQGCVINVDLSKDPTLWEKKRGIIVSMVKTGITPTGNGRNRYHYCAFHFHGDI